ncbi:prohead assembly (scaffolding) protein [Kosakonia phage Kc304]|uniref:Prohead assembly (Scaffolding) protein and protease n=2 Tax=Winklervirus chi14 TaxID=2560752 RepID=A0A1Z1LYI6_9CAUD|nr:head maturation protease [Serratia phage CHI14]ARW57875.1 prohead assembly (scaffolding) protein and protease [Serratia phage CBH8]QYN80622.1 prohead assembly (scaffolding) protein [Kosakonia phage Kc304]UJJ22168.1 prohead core scaffolding protein and protease [Erwinia phage Virsaitis27]UYM28832.1 prohead core scaffolding protein and protease [Serratia phage vB_SspM_LC53]ARW57600.1 prohead assembly (scaffolding) protein and protease [Serratia phage CHI14]
MNEPQLLIENWGQPGEVIDGKPMLESFESNEDSGLKPGLYIEGVFMQAEVVNRNKRLYPKRILEKAVSNYIKEQVQTKQALGELNHPPRANVDPMQAAIIIEDMWWKGNDVYGRARIIEGDHGPGDKLAANIRAGWIPGVSSRGLGALKPSGKGYNIVQEGFRLTVGVDAVWGPSAPDAWVTPKQISESVQETAQVANTSADDAFNALAERLKAL